MSDYWDEHGFAIMILVPLTIFGAIMVGFAYGSSVTAINLDNANSQAKHDLQIQGYTIYQGIVNSPTVIQVTNDYSYFTHIVTKDYPVYQTTIERNTAYIAIFNSTYGLAYESQVKTQYWWF